MDCLLRIQRKALLRKNIKIKGRKKLSSSHTESYSMVLDFPLEMINERLSSSLNNKGLPYQLINPNHKNLLRNWRHKVTHRKTLSLRIKNC